MNTTVNIPEDFYMNNGLPPVGHDTAIRAFSEDIFENLPPLLATACALLKQPEEKELFLIGALGVLSGIMPNVQGLYFGRQVKPNLYCYIIGKYGTGKGALLWARDLGAGVDAFKEGLAKDAIKNYQQEMVQYQRCLLYTSRCV